MAASAPTTLATTKANRLSEWAVVVLLFGAWLCMLLVLPRDMAAGSDADHRFQLLRHWIEDGIAPNQKWPMIGTILGAPMYFLGRLYRTPEWWMYQYPTLLFGVALVVLDRLLEAHLATAPRRRFLLLLMVASMVPYQLRSLSAESFNLSLLAVGYVALLQERWVLGTVAVALGGANIPATLGGVGLALLVSSVMLRKWRVLLPIVLAVLLTLTENWLKHGAPFSTPYLEDAEHGYRTLLPYSGLPGFSYPWLFGAISLLFSFGKGTFFFAPGMFLPLRRAANELPVLVGRLRCVWVAHVIGLLVVYSKWWAWYGGFTWGPRFLVFASVPASLVLALKVERPSEKLLENLVVFLALALSAWVGMCATVFGLSEQGFCTENDYALESFCWYLPEYSVLSRGIVMKHAVPVEHWILVVVSALTFLVTATPLLPVMARQLKALVVSGLQSARAQPFRF